jgi:hypothetical protein
MHALCMDPSGQFKLKQRHVYPTTHTGNVFSATFVPETRDRQIVTSSLDGAVMLHYLHSNGTAAHDVLFCDDGMVVRAVCSPLLPYGVVIGDNEGFVRAIDMRCPDYGTRGTEVHTSMNRTGLAEPPLTGLAFDPFASAPTLAVAEGGLVRVYDLRYVVRRDYPSDVSLRRQQRSCLATLSRTPTSSSNWLFENGISDLSYSPFERGRLLVNYVDDPLVLMEIPEGYTRATGSGYTDPFSPPVRFVFSCRFLLTKSPCRTRSSS